MLFRLDRLPGLVIVDTLAAKSLGIAVGGRPCITRDSFAAASQHSHLVADFMPSASINVR
jgi:hypothetical protein